MHCNYLSLTIIIYAYHCYVITGSSDYQHGPLQFTIPAGKTSFPVNVSIIIDNIFEEDEAFLLHINFSSIPNRVLTPRECMFLGITIENDDGEL